MADHQVEKVRIVATHAVRAARNGPAFLARLRASLGLTVEVLSPEEEARLSLQGVLSALAPRYLEAPSWSSMWAAAAPSLPWCARDRSPGSPACPWGSSP